MRVCVLCFGFRQVNLRLQPFRYVYEMCKAMHRAGWEVTVLTDKKNMTKIKDVDYVKEIPSFRAFGGYSNAVKESIRRIKPDVVVELLGAPDLLRKSDYQKPTIGIFTSTYTFGIARYKHPIVVLSEANKRKLLKLGLKDVTVIPPAPDEMFKSFKRPSKCEDILYLGSCDAWRGIGTLRKAWHLRKNNSGLIWFLTRQKGFMLTPEEVCEHVKRARIIALPFHSVRSDVPLTILEGMAAGKVVISTNVDGIPELLKGRGIVVEPRNARQLADAIDLIYSDDELADKLGARAAAFAKGFSWEKSGEQFVKLVRKVTCD